MARRKAKGKRQKAEENRQKAKGKMEGRKLCYLEAV
jgi:hypothetical protein